MLKITSLHTLSVTMERLRGLHTSQVVQLATVGLAHPERVDYHPSGWLSLRALLRRSEVGPDDVFADIGAGKGRVVYQAARRYGLKRVIGVELSPELAGQARANLKRHRRRLRCHDVEIVTSDALAWEVPDDLTIAYMFRPFTGATFRGVVHNLIASYDRSPRRLRILYVKPEDHASLMDTGRIREIPPPTGLIPRLQGYDPDWARLYEVTPRSSASS
jgi:SAM-dependent methyltransferase